VNRVLQIEWSSKLHDILSFAYSQTKCIEFCNDLRGILRTALAPIPTRLGIMARGVHKNEPRFGIFAFDHQWIIGCADINGGILYGHMLSKYLIEFSIVIFRKINSVVVEPRRSALNLGVIQAKKE